jgi:rhamnopyranosyl-N-acetylglucosaminyl-diphospho-decaprenol beta-1,3/1,4-galactofuranosyltransferase
MKTVCCIVVTYNRQAALRECLVAIQEGSLLPDTVLVVDNASTDGTSEMLRSEFSMVQVLSLSENSGGAGGFHAGLKWAYANGFDFFWVMDDDGIPSCNCLETILRISSAEDAAVVSPVLIDTKDVEALSFGLLRGKVVIGNLNEARGVFGESGFVLAQGSPFNGTLYRRCVVDRIGLPDHRLFIRGDETEYKMRYQRAGFRHGTTLLATHRHPSDLADKFPLIANRFVVNFTSNKLKDYCIFRNKAIIYRRYGRWSHLLFEIPKHLFFFLLKRNFDVNGFAFWVGAYSAGLVGRFGGERTYLSRNQPVGEANQPETLRRP